MQSEDDLLGTVHDPAPHDDHRRCPSYCGAMCDSLCVRSSSGMLFAKNSDRPPEEVQVVRCVAPRAPGSRLRTQYLELEDHRAAGTVLAQPTWLWGAEHGVNEHRVAIGNERIYTAEDPSRYPPALIGMDLVRLGLERGSTAEGALEEITRLLERHGQGGIGDQVHGEPYFSSFLIADPASAWVLETSGRSWAAEPVRASAVLSNRISIGTGWTEGSSDLSPGDDVDAWRDPHAPTGHADVRLQAGHRFLASRAGATLTARQLVAHLRDHGHGPWGAPGAGDPPQPPPETVEPDFTGVTVCMHVRGYMATTSSMVAELPAGQDRPLRAWLAMGSPCVSVYLPVFPPQAAGVGVSPQLADETLWQDLARLRELVEAWPESIADVRALLDPLEGELWDEADEVVSLPERWPEATCRWGERFAATVARLAGARSS